MRAEPGPTIKVLLHSVSTEDFCSTMRRLTDCLSKLAEGVVLAPKFIYIDPRQLAEKGVHPIQLPELAKTVETIAQRHPKLSFATKIEGRGSTHTWQVSISTTRIPVLSARRVSIIPSSRNYNREVAWALESLRKALIHSATTMRPDYSDFAEWSLPQHFYLFQKIAEVRQIRRMAEVAPATGVPNPMWPFPTELEEAIVNRFGSEPMLVPDADQEKGKLVQEMDACVRNHATNPALERFFASLCISPDDWFR